ncbi:MAG: hypothetical protein RIS86_1536 [Planctomycetota bacterium]
MRSASRNDARRRYTRRVSGSTPSAATAVLAAGFVEGLLRYAFAIAGMALVAWIAWKAVNRQESKDADFQRRLDEDDERAAKGRFGDPRGRS